MVDLPQQSAAGGDQSQWITIGISVMATALLLLTAFSMYALLFRRRESEEERQLRLGIAALRKRLGTTAASGFPLSTEHYIDVSWLWRGRKQPVVIQYQYIEAAARLSLCMDFDVNKFDAFCLCLEYSGNSYDVGASEEPPAVYQALRDWLLDLSQQLIQPTITHPVQSAETSGTEPQNPRTKRLGGTDIKRGCLLQDEQRFPYFIRFVSKARVWTDSGGVLFQRLRLFAQVLTSRRFMIYSSKCCLCLHCFQEKMKVISELCDARVALLASEEGGAALIAFYAPPNDGKDIKQILRQDHPEVRATHP